MKRLLLVLCWIVAIGNIAWGAKLFTTTIQNTTLKEVQERTVEYMVEKNFSLDRLEDHIVTFTKGFGDGFWLASRNMTVKINLFQQGDNVKMMVTQFEDSPQMLLKGQKAIDHLIPLIREIRHSIDNTPMDKIENEATDQQPGAKKKHKQNVQRDMTATAGLGFSGLSISKVDPGSIAERAGLQVGDLIIEVNAKKADDKALKSIDATLANGRSVFILYDRNGQQDIVTLRK